MQKDKILVFIPMYNCERQISRVLAQFTPDINNYFTEILVVDNISQDNSVTVAKEKMTDIKGVKQTLIQNKKNYSLGGSHKVAFNYAIENKFDYVIVLHGDDQGSIKDIIPCLETAAYQKYDSLLGSRFMQGALLEGYSFIRIALNIICNNVLSLVLRASVKDIGSGLNMYNVSYLKSQFYINFPNNLNYNVYMLFYGYYKKANTSFFPISWREDDQVSNARLVRQGIEILWIIIKYLLSPKTLFYRKSCTKNRSYLFDTVSKNK